MNINYLLIVKVPRGIVVRDTPRPESQGSKIIRSVAVGTVLEAYGIHNIQGVEYARLVPQNPQRSEWVRVKDANIEYVDIILLNEESSDQSLAAAIRDLAEAIRSSR